VRLKPVNEQNNGCLFSSIYAAKVVIFFEKKLSMGKSIFFPEYRQLLYGAHFQHVKEPSAFIA
jgi:hypothetical protein